MVTIEEQETVIQHNRSDDYATIYTSDSTVMSKLDKRCKTAPGIYSLERVETDKDGHIVGKLYKLSDKTLISLRKVKVVKNLTEEQRKELSERARSNFKKKAVDIDTTIDKVELTQTD